MFDKYIIDTSGNERAARILAESNAKHDKTLRDISEAEIKSKDRVDIPLSEYDRLRRENSDLSWQVGKMEAILEKLGIARDVIEKIDVDSVDIVRYNDPFNLKTRYCVTFTTDLYG